MLRTKGLFGLFHALEVEADCTVVQVVFLFVAPLADVAKEVLSSVLDVSHVDLLVHVARFQLLCL